MSSSLYHGKVMAGPMVRVSSLGFREYCAACGADVCFTEELVSAKLMKAKPEDVTYRIPVDFEQFAVQMETAAPASRDSPEEAATQQQQQPMTTAAAESLVAMRDVRVREFVVYDSFKRMKKRQVVLAVLLGDRVAEEESRPPSRVPLIIQLGAADPSVAASAAAVVADVADGFDVNMGCPKKFSIDNGMGAALMSDPIRAGRILAAINAAVNNEEALARRSGRRIPISFKTRVFADPAKSVEQLRTVMEHAGGPSVVHGISLHARTRDQRSETDPLTDLATAIVGQCRSQHPQWFPADQVSFVFNGSLWTKDMAKERLSQPSTVFQGALISRGCMWDPTVFVRGRLQAGPQLVEEQSTGEQQCRIYRRMMLYHFFYQTSFCYLKYHLTRSFQEFPSTKTVLHRRMQMARTYGEFGEIVGLNETFCREVLRDHTFETLLPAAAAVGGTEEQQEQEVVEERPAASTEKRPREE